MTKTSQEPVWYEPKAILPPSGDQSGPTSDAEVLVRFFWSLPSAFMTKMSPLPTSRVKAILATTGDPAEE
jgi:hypothetical protein